MSESSFLRETLVTLRETWQERRAAAAQKKSGAKDDVPLMSEDASRAGTRAPRSAQSAEELLSSTDNANEETIAPPLSKFKYSNRVFYMWCGRFYQMDDFIRADRDQVEVLSHTFKHPDGTRVTIIPIVHLAHPQFYGDVDALCSMHHSVLMEGRYGNTEADATTVPSREPLGIVRPKEEMDSEGWEPVDMEHFFQPYSWGVKGSPHNTTVHAADRYDYENLPWYAGVRFSVPMIGAFKREKHCMNLIPVLRSNGYKSFAVPWGAAHMPAFATMLEHNGFQPVAEQRLVVFNAIDGPISRAWVQQLRVQLRIAWSMRFLWFGLPGALPAYGMWCMYDGERPFTYMPSPKPLLPWYWSW